MKILNSNDLKADDKTVIVYKNIIFDTLKYIDTIIDFNTVKVLIINNLVLKVLLKLQDKF